MKKGNSLPRITRITRMGKAGILTAPNVSGVHARKGNEGLIGVWKTAEGRRFTRTLSKEHRDLKEGLAASRRSTRAV